jgi:hypothetical protein
MTTSLSDQDQRVRGELTHAIAELGHAALREARAHRDFWEIG